jgi:hypothetical protein
MCLGEGGGVGSERKREWKREGAGKIMCECLETGGVRGEEAGGEDVSAKQGDGDEER